MASFNFNWSAIALALGNAVFTHQISFRVGAYVVSAQDTQGKPVHFTYAAALAAATAVLTGNTGNFQSGTILVTISKG